MAFIEGGRQFGGGGGVDSVDGMLPAEEQKAELAGARRIRKPLAERVRGADSGRFLATQSVFSCSSLAITMILSPIFPGIGARWSSSPWRKEFLKELRRYAGTLY